MQTAHTSKSETAEILRGIERTMEILPFGLFRDEGRERPTGGLADYRQVKPWKKLGIAERIVRPRMAIGKRSYFRVVVQFES
jgi:hypothetical protein